MGNAMKKKLNVFIGLFLLFISCDSSTNEERLHYIESHPTFFELRNDDWLTNKWIRDSKNLAAIHETFKKIGYKNLISENNLSINPLIIQGIYINKKGADLLDSLELTYNHLEVTEKYYSEFWQRRKVEKNDSIVYIIIKEINYALKNKADSNSIALKANDKIVNDTLFKLLQIEFRNDSLTEQLSLRDFETLRQLGFHESAYNLLFETYKYYDIQWDRDSLIKTLKPSDKIVDAWFQDDTK